MITGLLFFLFRCFSYGFLSALLLLKHSRTLPPNKIFLIALAFPMGFGITSCTYFFWLLFHGPGGPFWMLDLLFLLVCVYAWRKTATAVPPAEPLPIDNQSPSRSERLLDIVYWPVFFASITIFAFFSINEPHGQWDAWATWNLRARYLFRGEDHWIETFTRAVASTNPDYPLLLPATVAQGWHIVRVETQWVPVLVALIFTLATAGILYSFLRIHRNRFQGQLGSLVLLCSPLFLDQGSAQMADVPLGCYYLLTVGFLIFAEARPEDRKLGLILAGLSAGFAAWTKNEGSVFLLSVMLMSAWSLLRRKKDRFFASLGFLLLGSAPGLLSLLVFKFHVSSPGYLLMKGHQTVLEGLTDLNRWVYVAQQFFYEFLNVGRQKIFLSLILLLFGLLLGFRKENIKFINFPIVSILFCLSGYFVFYMVTPLDYHWQIQTSLYRLFLHVFPALLFLFFFVVNTPSGGEASQPPSARF